MEVNPETSPYTELARHALHLARALQRRLDPVLSERLGIRGRELFVLRAVERGESNPMRIAERLEIAPSSASRTLDRLVELDLIDRASDPHDRRKARLTLTPHGRETVAQARLHVEEALRDAYRDVPRPDIENAARILARLVAHAEPDAPAGTDGHDEAHATETRRRG